MSTHQGQEINHITEIIQVMNSGIDFYQTAQDKVKDPAIGALFQRMIDARKVSVESLQPYAINQQGEREDGSSFVVEARRAFTTLISKFTNDNDQTYVKELEEVEDKTLEEIKVALKKPQSHDCEAALSKVLLTMQSCHAEMSKMQKH
ncbi:PA2169 family four-helix-bundle protein [Pseudoalteromonas sp. Scap03]|uniref:ferritin-like domain-containing protein n=1 Tax=unclassified Pseudoalteromonas TaxID=194690 RepID=UPI0015BC2404|nr:MULTISPECIES: PA2169 family four-helix-bundle protein [unclassified Pseudoalteromonas]NWL16025.1 PA2169 family four-helix-bundle protein [Pseudoalteromonas sp. Scap03]QLE81159.1 PA2169 family four-helix-bundle protein [Pseudoalteromonas sp. Scap25]QLE89102.1 PA2169 family four-helix-bundle protein [Pseudoalteromonas sp. Scap06]